MISYAEFVATLLKKDTPQLMALHLGLGVAGEAGELADAIKKEWIYNKPRDRENIVEELGDLKFYMQGVMNLYGITEGEIESTNRKKLEQRYKDLVYSDKAAQDRADKSPESVSTWGLDSLSQK